MRDFEKISFEQFKKDVKDDINLYNEYLLPQRDSDATAGYDIYLLEDLHIMPNEIKKLGRMVTGYIDSVWGGVRQIVLYEGLLAKFQQNEKLRKKLIGTGSALLAECS